MPLKKRRPFRGGANHLRDFGAKLFGFPISASRGNRTCIRWCWLSHARLSSDLMSGSAVKAVLSNNRGNPSTLSYDLGDKGASICQPLIDQFPLVSPSCLHLSRDSASACGMAINVDNPHGSGILSLHLAETSHDRHSHRY